ncbi:SWIM zinc finger family protein [Nocardioides sp. BP30]|uniref:SWIM zinc finger family protein n=1 Tax=Nocardioides sp. BP30 TaxID=3036374 RepID=UPI00246895D7|nr:SWIM zinc finger family protein [Nocardioides sp. BP30]WGL52646.1 SWIM zinc finger family protein [Nocardioides sp. BP30]
MTAMVFPQEPHRRFSRRLRSWWGRAFWRAVEETAYDEPQLLRARALARSGRIGGVVVDTGRFAAGVAEEGGIWTVTGALPPLDQDGHTAFLEVVAGRADALLAGDLPYDVVEHAEEAGVELVPYGTELAVTCSCPHWQRASRHGAVCEHAVAVLVQVSDLLDRDPLVLLRLRGIGRDELAPHRAPDPGRHPRPASAQPSTGPGADVGTIAPPESPTASGVEADEVEIAVDAALRAARLLAEAGAEPDPLPLEAGMDRPPGAVE